MSSLKAMLERSQKDVESALSTFQALQRFYRTDTNYKLIEQVQNYRGEAMGLVQLANIKRYISSSIDNMDERKKYIEFALADLKSAEIIYHKVENMSGLAFINGVRGQLYFNLGEYLLAKKEYENGLDIAVDIGDRPLEANMRDYISKVEFELNKRKIDILSSESENTSNVKAQEKEKMRNMFIKVSKGAESINLEGLLQLVAQLGNDKLTSEEKDELMIQLGMKKGNNGSVAFDVFWNWWQEA